MHNPWVSESFRSWLEFSGSVFESWLRFACLMFTLLESMNHLVMAYLRILYVLCVCVVPQSKEIIILRHLSNKKQMKWFGLCCNPFKTNWCIIWKQYTAYQCWFWTWFAWLSPYAWTFLTILFFYPIIFAFHTILGKPLK